MAIAVYLRLSEADGDLGKDGKDESNSIANQRELLYNFIGARQDIEGDIIEYIDDGYSGTNFERPGFQKMIEDAKKGMIDTIVVKDLSRLGRDYITAGDYIEQIFPLLNVRFIAANNGFDSKKQNDATMGFEVAVNNLVNTFYSRDLSKKMKAANKVRWKQGISTAGHAPFGYVRSAIQKGKYDIDPEAAAIVRFIFEKAIEGHCATDIARLLNERKYPTPLVYQKTRNAWNFAEPVTIQSERLWDNSKVLSILERIEYTGVLVMGRQHSVTVGARSTKPRPKNEWVVVENVNEPIVATDDFKKANEVIRQIKQRDFLIPQKYPLKGKVRCGNCKQCLSYTVTTYKEYFVCRHGRQVDKHSKCCKDEYPIKVIETIVWKALVNMISTLQKLGTQVEAKTKQQLIDISKVKTETERKVALLKEERIQLYELYAAGTISKDRYILKRSEISKQIEEAEKTLSNIIQGMNNEKELLNHSTDTNALVSRFSGADRLSRAIVKAFIETVYIYDTQHIEIVFTHSDILKQFENYMSDHPTKP